MTFCNSDWSDQLHTTGTSKRWLPPAPLHRRPNGPWSLFRHGGEEKNSFACRESNSGCLAPTTSEFSNGERWVSNSSQTINSVMNRVRSCLQMTVPSWSSHPWATMNSHLIQQLDSQCELAVHFLDIRPQSSTIECWNSKERIGHNRSSSHFLVAMGSVT
jgi:hypothetical protein